MDKRERGDGKDCFVSFFFHRRRSFGNDRTKPKIYGIEKKPKN